MRLRSIREFIYQRWVKPKQDAALYRAVDLVGIRLSQAFRNIQERNGGQPVPQDELYVEYARLCGANGCPCSKCTPEET